MAMSRSERARFDALREQVKELQAFVRKVQQNPQLLDQLRKDIDALAEQDGPPEEAPQEEEKPKPKAKKGS